MMTESAKTVLGENTLVHQDWFDEKNEQLNKVMKEGCNAFIEWQHDVTSQSKKDHFKYLKSKTQSEL